MNKPSIAELLNILINLTPEERQEMVEYLGPCMTAVELRKVLTWLSELKDVAL